MQQVTDPAVASGSPTLQQPRLRWWREVLTVVVFYELYSLARNTQGSGSTSPTHAFRNARVVINLERAIGLYHEESIQRLFLGMRPLVKVLNVYYGSAHFLVTAGVLAWLFLRHPDRYPRWRWSLACTTLIGLLGFLAFPLMPPRLISPAFGVGSYVDTLRTVGGLWNFEEGAIAKLSNQYAAMPSLHFAWSLWCCLALWPRLRTRWARTLIALHPAITLVAIVATANHYWLDALAGALALLGGWLLGGVLCTWAIDRVAASSRIRRAPTTATTTAAAAVATGTAGTGTAAAATAPTTTTATSTATSTATATATEEDGPPGTAA